METQVENKGNGKSRIKKRRFTKKDMTELCVFATYLVQKLGEASIHDVQNAMKRWEAQVNVGTLSKAMEALKSKEHVAALFRQGERVFKIKRLKFNKDLIEIPQIDEMISLLLKDPAGIAIQAELRAEDQKGPTKRITPEGMADFEMTFQLTTPWHGAYVIEGNQYLAATYEASNFNNTFDPNCDPTMVPRIFERAGSDSIVVHTGCVTGFLAQHSHKVGISEYMLKKWFGIQPIIHKPSNIVICKYPIIKNENGRMTAAGFGYYETMMPGEVITWRFSAPTVNFALNQRSMERFIRRILASPGRSMSPARGSQTGSAELLTMTCSLWDDQDKEITEPGEVN